MNKVPVCRAMALSLGALAAGPAAAYGQGPPVGQGPADPDCRPASNVQAIIDDSGSMRRSDPHRLRVSALTALIASPASQGRTLGATSFGTRAWRLFSPAHIGARGSMMRSALERRIRANDGETNYNAAFASAKQQNPTADARIFLTDSGHNVGRYRNAHHGGPPTYVVGLGRKLRGREDRVQLQKIASSTGGRYYRSVDDSSLTPTLADIENRLNCQGVSRRVTSSFTREGVERTQTVSIAPTTQVIDVRVSWENPRDRFAVDEVTIQGPAGPAAPQGVQRTSGKTFVNSRITVPEGVTPNAVNVEVESRAITEPGQRRSVTTHVTPSPGR